MPSILEYLQDLLYILFSFRRGDAEKRRGLRAIYDQLRQVQPLLYRRGTDQVLPAFAAVLGQFAAQLSPIDELLQKTVCNEDARLAERYKDYLVVARLPEAQQLLPGGFTYREMKGRIAGTTDPEEELRRIEREFQDFMLVLASPALYGFDVDYTSLDRLVALCRHDHGRLLSLFGVKPRGEAADAGEVHAVAAEQALPGLLDLYFVLAGVELSDGLLAALGHLLERLEREGAAESQEKLRRHFARLRKLRSLYLKNDLLLGMIRLSSKDPHYQPKMAADQVSHLDYYKRRLTATYQRDRERLSQEINEGKVSEDIRILFAGADLLSVLGYEEEVAGLLRDRQLSTFLHVKPLRVLKSYILAHFERELREPVKKLLVEGAFENRIFHDMLSNTYYGCEAIMDDIRQFEEQLTGEDQFSASKLRKYVEMYDQGKNVEPLITQVVEAVDLRARQMVEKGANLFYNLGALLAEILEDARQKNPNVVNNVRVLGGKANREFLGRLSMGAGSLDRLAKIMKNFTVIHRVGLPEMGPPVLGA